MDFKQYNYESAKWRLETLDDIDLSTLYGKSTILEQVDTYFRTSNGDRLRFGRNLIVYMQSDIQEQI